MTSEPPIPYEKAIGAFNDSERRSTTADGFTACEWCGSPAVGLAYIGDNAYCHDTIRSCYEQAQEMGARSLRWLKEND